jgi:hypothetical protein
MPRASSAGCWADDPALTAPVTLDFWPLKHDIPASNAPRIDPRPFFQEGSR